MSKYLPIILRQTTTTDLPFIYSTWLNSYRRSPFGLSLSTTNYFQTQTNIIDNILLTAKLTLATLEEDPDTICGFICHDISPNNKTIIHYIYTKLLFRNDGVAKQLYNSISPTNPTIITHNNHTSSLLREKYHLIKERIK